MSCVFRFARSFVLSFIVTVVVRYTDVSEMIYVKRRCLYVSVAPSCNTVGEDVSTGSSALRPPPPLCRVASCDTLRPWPATWRPRGARGAGRSGQWERGAR